MLTATVSLLVFCAWEFHDFVFFLFCIVTTSVTFGFTVLIISAIIVSGIRFCVCAKFGAVHNEVNQSLQLLQHLVN